MSEKVQIVKEFAGESGDLELVGIAVIKQIRKNYVERFPQHFQEA